MKKERNRMKKAQSRKREPFRIYRASITVEAALLYPILIFLLMFLLQKTITYYQQTDQAAQGIISVEEPDTSKMFWKIVLAQRVTEEIKEKAQSRKREPFRIYRASITVEAALLYPILIFLLMFLLQKTITYYQQTDQAAQGIISVEEPDTSKMFWKIVLAQRVTEEIKEKAGLQEDNVYEN